MTMTRGQWLEWSKSAERPYTDSKYPRRRGLSTPMSLKDVSARAANSTVRTRKSRAAAKEAGGS